MLLRLFLLLGLLTLLSACAASPAAVRLSVVETRDSTRLIRHTFGETSVPLTPKRIVALGEESLLADLLDAGVRPIAASVNVPAYVPLLETAELQQIVLFPSASKVSLETFSSYQPDLIIGTSFFIEQFGYQQLSRIAPTVALGGATPFEQYRETLTVLGQAEQAERDLYAFRAELHATAAQLRTAEQRVSVATVYPGATVALWLDGPTAVPFLLRELGVQIRPDPASASGLSIRSGRAFINLEQLALADGTTLMLLQSSAVEGEASALVDIQAKSLWQQLPAVQAGQVVTLDRLGYPGMRGQRALLREMNELLQR